MESGLKSAGWVRLARDRSLDSRTALSVMQQSAFVAVTSAGNSGRMEMFYKSRV
jgi:hypothetical protein